MEWSRSKLFQFCLLIALAATLPVLSSCGGGGGGGDGDPPDPFPVFLSVPSNPFGSIDIHMNAPMCLDSLSFTSVVAAVSTEPKIGEYLVGTSFFLKDDGFTIAISRAGGWDFRGDDPADPLNNRMQIFLARNFADGRPDPRWDTNVPEVNAFIRSIEGCTDVTSGRPVGEYTNQLFFNEANGLLSLSNTNPIFSAIVDRDIQTIITEFIVGQPTTEAELTCENIWRTNFGVAFRVNNGLFDIPATFSWSNSTLLVGDLPAFAAQGSVDLKLTNGSLGDGDRGEATFDNIFVVTNAGKPIFTAFTPQTVIPQSQVVAGFNFTVIGDRFITGLLVRIGAQDIAGTVVVDNTELTGTWTEVGVTQGLKNLRLENPGATGGIETILNLINVING